MTELPLVRSHAGDRDPRLGRSPFGPAAPSILAAMTYGVAALVWTVAGSTLPGGRWLAVHIFTLGVLTNLVLVFSEHFGRTLTRTRDWSVRWQMPVVNIGIVLTLVAIPAGARWATSLGATVVTGAVTASAVRLRKMRSGAIGARFGWIVRSYEWAHAAFIAGATLGLLMGVGLLQGRWYGAARTAHLHLNILGWAGLTLLATVVFFGPTIVRTRIVKGADVRAAVALQRGAIGLSAAVLLLLATGINGPAAIWLRIAAAAAMAVYAIAVAVVCRPVATGARAAKPTATRWPLIAMCIWFPVVAWSDVAIIATGGWRWLDALGLAMILGVLVQIFTAVLTYLAPMLRSPNGPGRELIRARFEVGARTRSALFNLGALAVVSAAAVRTAAGATAARVGWAMVIGSLIWLLGTGLRPVPRGDA